MEEDNKKNKDEKPNFDEMLGKVLTEKFKDYIESRMKKEGGISDLKGLGSRAELAVKKLAEIKADRQEAPNVATPLAEIEIDGVTHQIQISIVGDKKMFLGRGISGYSGFKMENTLN